MHPLKGQCSKKESEKLWSTFHIVNVTLGLGWKLYVMSVVSKKTCHKFQYVGIVKSQNIVIVNVAIVLLILDHHWLKNQTWNLFQNIRNSLETKKAKSKKFFPGKLSILTLGELLEYITSKHENVGNVLQFLLRFHPRHSGLKMTKFEFNVLTKSMQNKLKH